ncbi:hypothetical protein GF337_04790 [candidate division KSB1 bacterium]|nr:hypothetical protein [candidate division KSB1 bacterium]
MEPARFEIVDDLFSSRQKRGDSKKRKFSSFDRLLNNSQRITKLFTSRAELKKLRFDELDMLRDLRELVEAADLKFEEFNNPSLYRREIRSRILPKYLTNDFVRSCYDKILSQLIRSSSKSKDQDALMTALVFLQSHTDLGVPPEDNPLWEIIFNLSIKDGFRFVDSLSALFEGLDTVEGKDQDGYPQEPPELAITKEVCQWKIFWRQVVEHENVRPYEALVSRLLRGDLLIDLYFDEIIHLPLLLHRLFKDQLSDENFLSDDISEIEKEFISRNVFKNILRCAEVDIPPLIPKLIERIKQAKKAATKQEEQEIIDQFDALIKSLKQKHQVTSNTFILTLLIAKISIRKFWDNRRDFFTFLTIFKNPEEPRGYYDLSQIMYKQKYFDSIENVLKCAIELNPDQFWGYWGLGNFQLKQNQFAESKQNLTKALTIVQHLEIQNPGALKRELFLIKEDIKKLNSNKVKHQADTQRQIDLF